jgi:hypothetical protein
MLQMAMMPTLASKENIWSLRVFLGYRALGTFESDTSRGFGLATINPTTNFSSEEPFSFIPSNILILSLFPQPTLI